MKLATLKDGSRDGRLVVVSADLLRCVPANAIAPTLQAALDHWAEAEPALRALSARLNAGDCGDDAEDFHPIACHSPLPRAYQWADGSAYVNHVELVRKARGAEMPASFWTDPLIYQGGSDAFLDPMGPIEVESEDWGIDLEAEVAAITGDVPMACAPETACERIRLLMLVNDVSLRNLIPNELAKGFGFFQSKPSSAFSPVAVTPDELGPAWDGGRVHLPLRSLINGQPLGMPDAGVDLRFSDAGSARSEDSASRGGQHHRLGHGIESRQRRRPRQGGRRRWRRLLLSRRGAHDRDHPPWQAEDTVPALWRRSAHRDARCPGPLDLRRDRAGRRPV